MGEAELRMEDFGKMMLQNATVKSSEELVHQFKKFFIKNIGCQYYILLSTKYDYYTVFRTKSPSVEEMAANVYDFLEHSYFYKNEEYPYNKMSDIKYYEYNEELNHLELWISDEYFQLCTFDWGVEEI